MKEMTRKTVGRRPAVLWLPWLASLLLLGGCGGGEDPEAPETHEVKGKVVWSDGTPLAGGQIEFQSTGETDFTILAQVQTDGTFSLRTLHNGKQSSGAVEGTFRVVVMQQMSQEAEQTDVRPIMVRKPVTVKPGDNVVTVQLPGKAP